MQPTQKPGFYELILVLTRGYRAKPVSCHWQAIACPSVKPGYLKSILVLTRGYRTKPVSCHNRWAVPTLV
ncbi:MAG: hypothetical protein EBE86_010570 [Hormoscilla sp. GUM202]|nr:hypothetical protein [Hormoscilla sp. GUM202]